MGTAELGAFVERALFLDRDDPEAAWGELHDLQARLIDRLSAAEEIRIEAEGTDLRVRVGGRTWVNSDGKRNMPSGEVFTGPHEDSAEGRIRFTIPSSPRGVEVAGIELEFRAGVVVGRARRARPRVPARDARHRPGRAPAGRDRDRHEPRDRPPDRRDPVRREDRRDRPLRGRPLLPGDRRHERQRGPLGHDLRPPRGRDADRRRRGRPAGRRLRLSAPLRSPPFMRRTKIVATIGPASREPEVLVQMVEAGMDVARLNFSHGSAEEHAETAQRVRDAANRAGRSVAILQDLPGPKLRIGKLTRRHRRAQAGRRGDVRLRRARRGGRRDPDVHHLGRARRHRRAGRGHVPRRRRRAAQDRRRPGAATARSTRWSRSAARSPRARA